MIIGDTASEDGNLVQLSKVSEEKPPIKETLPGPKPFLNASGDIQKIIKRMNTYKKN